MMSDHSTAEYEASHHIQGKREKVPSPHDTFVDNLTLFVDFCMKLHTVVKQ